MKTPEEIAEEIVTEITTGGTIAFAGLDRSPTLHEMERAIVLRAIKADRAQRHPVSIDPDEAQALADRYRAAAEARKGHESDLIPAVPLDVFEYIDEKIGSQDYAPYTLAASDNDGYVDVIVIADYRVGESVYKYTRDPDGAVTWELLAARAKRSTP